ncbi:uncharacterized [Tachysurus ichikawai]
MRALWPQTPHNIDPQGRLRCEEPCGTAHHRVSVTVCAVRNPVARRITVSASPSPPRVLVPDASTEHTEKEKMKKDNTQISMLMWI